MKIPQPNACLSIEDLEIGQEFSREYSISYEDVVKFSEVSGDWNPVHHDEEYAKSTFFGQRIAHGMLIAAQFSGIFGMDAPGLGTIWLKQGISFLAPVFLDTPYIAKITVTSKDHDSNTVIFLCECFDKQENLVMTGEGELKPIPVKVKNKMMQEN